VDDNLINQQVADELLSAEGANVTLAANGLLAVQAVAAAAPPFDIVLMDIQMPVLDGFGATRQIREVLGLQDLPIVAMTANAMASDREACLAAGMNEHVGKPFDVAHLVSVMLRLTGMQVGPDAPASGACERRAPHGLLDMDGLELSAALERLANLRPLYVRAAQDFCQQLQPLLSDLRREFAAADFKGMAMRLHTLKGNAGTLGAVELAHRAAALETICKSGGGQADVAADMGADLAALGACIQHTIGLLEQAVRALADEVPAGPTDLQSGLQGDALQAVLRDLADLARAEDFGVLQRFAEVRDRLGHTPDGFVDALAQALQDLDWNAAHALCARQLARPPG
jgi:CheY-like chemotaxis protein